MNRLGGWLHDVTERGLSKVIHGWLGNTKLHDPLASVSNRLGFKACFTAGTPIVSLHGSKAIEDFKSYEDYGEECDWVWSRDEFDADSEPRLRRVLRTFVRESLVLNLHVGGKIIGTTHEHPFFVKAKGWTNAHELRIGDEIRVMDAGWTKVEGIADAGQLTTVYNLEVEDDHTYFVGGTDWGWAVWAHNAKACLNARKITDRMQYLVDKGVPGAAHLKALVDKGYLWAKFQAKVAIQYYKAGHLLGIEVKLAGKAGRIDLLLKNGNLVEVKHWTGWFNRVQSLRVLRLGELEKQVGRYLKDPARNLKMVFRFNGAHYPNGTVPSDILNLLQQMQAKYGMRLKWVVK